jgi:cobalt-zinc-cadmium efflux system protein
MAGVHATPQSAASRLRLALGLDVVIVVAQIVAGMAASSLGLLSDAGHNLTDVAGLALALLAVRMTRRPATAERSFGWHRGTILAAQANAAMILALTSAMITAAVRTAITITTKIAIGAPCTGATSVCTRRCCTSSPTRLRRPAWC